jgi:hypothetical protein
MVKRPKPLHHEGRSGQRQVGCGNLAVATAFEIVADLLALGEAGKARALDGGDVDECVLAAVFRLDEAEALGRVEEFNGADLGDSPCFGLLRRMRTDAFFP